jgi:hypothetical protein
MKQTVINFSVIGTLAFELFEKRAALRNVEIQRELDRGQPFERQCQIQHHVYLIREGTVRALADLERWKNACDRAFSEERFEAVRFFGVVFSEVLPVVGCGGFYPEFVEISDVLETKSNNGFCLIAGREPSDALSELSRGTIISVASARLQRRSLAMASKANCRNRNEQLALSRPTPPPARRCAAADPGCLAGGSGKAIAWLRPLPGSRKESSGGRLGSPAWVDAARGIAVKDRGDGSS